MGFLVTFFQRTRRMIYDIYPKLFSFVTDDIDRFGKKIIITVFCVYLIRDQICKLKWNFESNENY